MSPARDVLGQVGVPTASRRSGNAIAAWNTAANVAYAAERRPLLRRLRSRRMGSVVFGGGHAGFCSGSILRVSRGSTNGSLSSGLFPPSIARPRSSSALNSAPRRMAMFEIHSHTRKTITPPSAP